jgi:streptogramin lyase
VVVAAVVASTALAATPPKITLHSARPDTADGLAPDTIASASNGDLWFTERSPVGVGRINPRNGSVRSFRVPGSGKVSALGGITAGPGHYVWVAVGNAIDRITLKTGAAKIFKLPSRFAEPFGLAKGPDGNLWFTDGTGSIGRLVPSTGAVTEYPETGGAPAGIVSGPDGNLWFTDGTGSIGKVNPSTGAVTQVSLPASSCNTGTGPTAWAIISGPGRNLWFTTYSTDEVGRIDPITGRIKLFCLKSRTGSNEFSIGIATGRDGNVWLTTESTSDRVGRIKVSNGKISRFPLPAGFDGGGPGITQGSDRNLWITLPNAKKIARLR